MGDIEEDIEDLLMQPIFSLKKIVELYSHSLFLQFANISYFMLGDIVSCGTEWRISSGSIYTIEHPITLGLAGKAFDTLLMQINLRVPGKFMLAHILQCFCCWDENSTKKLWIERSLKNVYCVLDVEIKIRIM